MTDLNDVGAKLGVVSFLNARPLVEGLEGVLGVRLRYAVPSVLSSMLQRGEVDAALIPVIDLARMTAAAPPGQAWERISDAGIACDGETLTVRVFSRVAPETMRVLHVDTDSHTSIALAQLIWRHWYHRPVRVVSLGRSSSVQECESVLLIGDKVVNGQRRGFEFQIDLGAAWKAWTGLPFVFAVWAARVGPAREAVARLLSEARDRGVARATAIAAEAGPSLGWPVALAREYLTRRMRYHLTPEAEEGMRRFLTLAAREGLIAESGVSVA